MTRPLHVREWEALEHLLAIDFPGVVELRQQAASVRADGTAMIASLYVGEDVPRAAVVNRTPVQAVVDGFGYDGGLLLFVDDGRLSALEYWWVTDDMPDEFPPLSAIGQPIAH